MKVRLRRGAVVVALCLLATSATHEAIGDDARFSRQSLPSPRSSSSSVFTGSDVFVFGGEVGTPEVTQILRYTPSTNRVATMQATLPSGTTGTSAIWTGRYAFIFGGTDQVLRYDPYADSIMVMKAKLPYAREYAAASWSGQYVYLFGGRFCMPATCYLYSNQVLRYDPRNDTMTVVNAFLPVGTFAGGAVWVGDYGYFVGGSTGGSTLRTILRYSPFTETVETMVVRLPTASAAPSVISDGFKIYVFGGVGNFPSNEIMRYDVQNDLAVTMSAVLPTARYFTTAAFTGQTAFIIGGIAAQGTTSEIVRYVPSADVVAAGVLPSPRYATTASAAGTTAYIAGGFSGGSPISQIIKYDTATGYVTSTASLPSGRYGSASVFDGQDLYVFGGYRNTFLGDIIRYRPSDGTVATMNATIPGGLAYLSAVYSGGYAFLFGGVNASGATAQILRYDPSNDSLTAMTAILPSPRFGTAAALVGTSAFILGGSTCGTPSCSATTDQILRYDIAFDTLAVEGSTLTPARTMTSAVSDGALIHIFGGRGGSHLTDVQTYDPATYTISLRSAQLPVPGCCASAIWSGNRAFIFGGTDGLNPTNAVVEYVPNAGPPTSVSASAGPGAHEVTLSWGPPDPASHPYAITGFRVYRRFGTGSPTLIAQLGPTDFSFTETSVPNGSLRYMTVRAFDVSGEGEPSPEVSAAAPTPPSRMMAPLFAPGPMLGDFTVIWLPPDNDGGLPVTAYKIYRSNLTTVSLIATVVAPATMYTDSSCPSLSFCEYAVSAVNGAGEGGRTFLI